MPQSYKNAQKPLKLVTAWEADTTRVRGHDHPVSTPTSLYGRSFKGQHCACYVTWPDRVGHKIFVWRELPFARSLAFFVPIWSIILLLREIIKKTKTHKIELE